jgi:hypothetical protein
MPVLRHYAAEAFELDRGRVYSDTGHLQVTGMKPAGFWVTVPGEDDWPAWCRGEGFGLDRLVVAYDVVLSPTARMLSITSAADLVTFDREYGGVPEFLAKLGIESRFARGIRWAELHSEYDGILIYPYQWSVRWELPWYSSWDVASGCIWNLDAIAALNLVDGEAAA